MSHLKLAEVLFEYLVDQLGLPLLPTAEAALADYTEGNRRHPPGFLYERTEIPREMLRPHQTGTGHSRALPSRQARHLAVT